MVASIQLPEVGLSCFIHLRVIAFFLAVKSTPLGVDALVHKWPDVLLYALSCWA